MAGTNTTSHLHCTLLTHLFTPTKKTSAQKGYVGFLPTLFIALAQNIYVSIKKHNVGCDPTILRTLFYIFMSTCIHMHRHKCILYSNTLSALSSSFISKAQRTVTIYGVCHIQVVKYKHPSVSEITYLLFFQRSPSVLSIFEWTTLIHFFQTMDSSKYLQ